ncbi:MAG: phosphoenolpyruvate synthase [Nitrospirae bacterium]|jgi:pyruvate,water dikinase|nr:phosphoenolpyruvate synthase [Nitrospirota bacterium]
MRYIRFFNEIKLSDIPLVGGKNASLGEMYQELVPQGVKVPNGFAITADAYWDLLKKGGIMETLQETLNGLDRHNIADLERRGKMARDLILGVSIPADMWAEIEEAYGLLGKEYGDSPDVAVRSSATAEDLPTASFAGQQDTYLNIRGLQQLREACLKCFASLYTDRAISYRVDHGFDHFSIALSICVMKMVRSDKGSSGVLFTLDTETGFRDVVFITGAYGLGENVVQGNVDPDEFYVYKPTFKTGHRSIIRKNMGKKQFRMVYASGNAKVTVANERVSAEEAQTFCLSDDEILTLTDYAIKVEEHYTRKAGVDRPMDMEWAKDGVSGELFLVQARPETVESQKNKAEFLEAYTLDEKSRVLLRGKAVGQRIASGKVHVIRDLRHIRDFKPGEILVAETTTPDWEPVMKTAAAIITSRGGRTCHAAIVSRELGIPAVVGAEGAIDALSSGQEATVSCAQGDTGMVYEGLLKFHVDRTQLDAFARPKTKVMMNLGDPDQAFGLSFIPNDGVGLARMEFIINGFIKIHPMALVHPEKVTDPKVMAEIESMTAGYRDMKDYFVEKLAFGIGTIAAGFYPKPVTVRMSDFKSNEYASLIGGAAFEPHEENPMLGFRGASRYISPRYEEGFALECQAIRRVRDVMGLTNVRIMIPFCRTLKEARGVIEVLEKNGLKRGVNGLEVFVMCEIPNNVILIDEFAKYFDGFSIGSNDLTQLTLGVDRDSEILAESFDERDEGVQALIRMAVEGAKRNKAYSGICGQAPSDFPEIAEALVRMGIDSISLNPDTVIKTTLKILEVEKSLGKK